MLLIFMNMVKSSIKIGIDKYMAETSLDVVFLKLLLYNFLRYLCSTLEF